MLWVSRQLESTCTAMVLVPVRNSRLGMENETGFLRAAVDDGAAVA